MPQCVHCRAFFDHALDFFVHLRLHGVDASTLSAEELAQHKVKYA